MRVYELGELLPYEQPSKYIVDSTEYNDGYPIPVLTAGKSFILGYTNESNNIFDDLPVIIFDDFTTATQYVDFKFKVKSSAMKILHINQDLVLPKFIFYKLQTISIDHSTHKRYWIQQYSKIRISIPTILEQEQIVKQIEESLSQLDSAVATLNKTSKQLSLFRFAIIDALLQSDNLFEIRNCIENIGQGWSPKCLRENTLDDDIWAVIKTSAIQAMRFECSENKVLPTEISPRQNNEIHNGDILVTRAGPRKRCGVCCMVRTTKKKLLCCDKVYQIRVDKSIVNPRYFEYVLNSPRFVQQIEMCKTGGNDSGVNLTQNRFLSIKIPVPSLTVQERIIKAVDSKFSICNSIEQIENSALQQAEVLRQSILKKAFEEK